MQHIGSKWKAQVLPNAKIGLKPSIPVAAVTSARYLAPPYGCKAMIKGREGDPTSSAPCRPREFCIRGAGKLQKS
jgi:hypothetical protein